MAVSFRCNRRIGFMTSGKSIPERVRDEGELLSLIGSVLEHPARPELGIGDDAALVKSEGEWTVATMDTMVEGRHFRIGRHTSWRDVGWKCITTNQSDIAAMGAKPAHALIGLNVRRGMSGSDIVDLYEGMQAAMSAFGGVIVGGDTVVSDEVSITVAMTGSGATPKTAFRSDAARLGDVIAVSGSLGDSRGGLEALAADQEKSETDIAFLIDRHNMPIPRTDLVSPLQDAGVRCATDISDGLVRDLEKVCAASGLTAQVDLGRIPMSPHLLRSFPDRALEFALSGGEDYELLLAAPVDVVTSLNAALVDASKSPVTVIGEVTGPDSRLAADATIGRVTLRGNNAGNVAASLASSGWDHWDAAGEPSAIPC